MIGKIYKTLQRSYPTDNLLNINCWNQDLKRTDVGTIWRESWSRTNKIIVNENVCRIKESKEFIIKDTTFTNSTARWHNHVLSVK